MRLPEWLRNLVPDAWKPTPDELEQGLYAVITINSRTGETQVEAVNGDGKDCLALTQELEDSMGGVTHREMKPESSMVNRPSKKGGRVRKDNRNTTTQ
jgi:hypothetical protein